MPFSPRRSLCPRVPCHQPLAHLGIVATRRLPIAYRFLRRVIPSPRNESSPHHHARTIYVRLFARAACAATAASAASAAAADLDCAWVPMGRCGGHVGAGKLLEERSDRHELCPEQSTASGEREGLYGRRQGGFRTKRLQQGMENAD
jgi:hypothetical protein